MSDRLTRIAAVLLALPVLASHPALGSGELVDPTRPPNAIPSELQGPAREVPWLLSAIFIAQGRQIAVVNGRPVKAGEVVDGATVKRIARTGVLLATPDGDLDLPLVEARVKPTEANLQ